MRIGQGRTDTQEMNSPETSRTCLNCGTQVDGRYCPRCGQEYGSTRITWRSLYDEAVSIFIGDSIFSEKDAVVRYGILRTLWSILIRPTTTVREYLAGQAVQIRPAAHAADARLHDLPAAAELVPGQTAGFFLFDRRRRSDITEHKRIPELLLQQPPRTARHVEDPLHGPGL